MLMSLSLSNVEDGYYRARVERHARYMCLSDAAWNLILRLNAASDQEYAQCGPFVSKRLARLWHITARAERRWSRRRDTILWLGMDEAAMQELSTGDVVYWRGERLTVTDWNCHRDPIFGPNSRRIWAEPVFENERGMTVYVSPIYWHEMI